MLKSDLTGVDNLVPKMTVTATVCELRVCRSNSVRACPCIFPSVFICFFYCRLRCQVIFISGVNLQLGASLRAHVPRVLPKDCRNTSSTPFARSRPCPRSKWHAEVRKIELSDRFKKAKKISALCEVCHRDFGPAGILVRADQNPREAAR